jgi:hypothetical protein
MVEEHLPVTIINDWNLNRTDLSRYRVLILPNTTCLDDAQAEAIARFVHDCGGLVATLDVGLVDELGNPRPGFALSSVLGVRYRGLPDGSTPSREELDVNFARAIGADYWEKRKGAFDFKPGPALLVDGRIKAYLGDQPVTFKGPAVRIVPTATARTLAMLRVKGASGAAELPAIVTHTYGKGRVVYLAAGLDAAYYLYAYPYQRLALRSPAGLRALVFIAKQLR